MTTIRSILIPMDFAAESVSALRYAILLAERLDAELHLLHVVRNTLGAAPRLPVAPGELSSIREATARDVKERMNQFLAAERLEESAERMHSEVRLVVAEGVPAKQMVRYAQDVSIDLIVMATHGRGLFGELLHGSVAHQVVNAAPCPVLLCPPRVRVPTPHAERTEKTRESAALESASAPAV